jgi:hypothetical protein
MPLKSTGMLPPRSAGFMPLNIGQSAWGKKLLEYWYSRRS